ncbi:MAG: fructosamine kinase family protein [Cyclobacteriaceae bacterium]|nr:fructosamine kinase family protein [Cyclobacteriaceae bacterium]
MTNLPTALQTHISEKLSWSIKTFTSASGGCINHGGELVTTEGSYFLKWNDRERYPQMFEKESKGLTLLRTANSIDVPEVIHVGETDDLQFIIMSFVKAGRRAKNYWSLLGEQLAGLHRNTHTCFGLDHDNYIGSLIQKNSAKENWLEFFIEQRLEAQLALAEGKRKINAGIRKQFEQLYQKLPDLFPQEKPALLHGDLWNGNVMVNEKGEPTLIDPAVYYGHREAELAFTQLFGGFDQEFYLAYHNAFPLSPGFDARTDLYNLYPLLVHVNLFGGGYLQQAVNILSRYV